MNAQPVASTLECTGRGHARVEHNLGTDEARVAGWGGAMRGALEEAAVWVAPSMNAQDSANIIWGLATLGWQAGFEVAAGFQQLIEGLGKGCEHGLVQV